MSDVDWFLHQQLVINLELAALASARVIVIFYGQTAVLVGLTMLASIIIPKVINMSSITSKITTVFLPHYSRVEIS